MAAINAAYSFMRFEPPPSFLAARSVSLHQVSESKFLVPFFLCTCLSLQLVTQGKLAPEGDIDARKHVTSPFARSLTLL